MRRIIFTVFLLTLLALTALPLAAQTTSTLPSAYQLSGIQHIYQDWNNCGPATLTMGLSYFTDTELTQYPAATYLKPNYEDKNVSPWQMVNYVNDEYQGDVYAMLRNGGTVDLLKTLIANNFPVLVEAGFDPPNDDQGWMGHYLLVSGYDDTQGLFYTQDSFEGPDYTYAYDYFDEYWRHFNRVYIPLYPLEREAELLALLGTDADEATNWSNALETARQEAIANPDDPFAWFNMGTSFAGMGMYEEAAVAFDQSRAVGGGLPWRMMWYQFGPFEAYLQVGRYQDVIDLAQANLNDGGGQYVEETYYYAGLARAAMGERDRAILNLDGAISFNPNFTPAREARDDILNG
jgi:hypothetical protein